MRVLVVLVLLFSPARSVACQLALVLGVDVSHSIDNGEYALQVGGMAEALADPVIADALASQETAVTVVQWSGVGEQEISIPWVQIRTPRDARVLAQRMRTLRRPWDSSNTAVGEALTFMARTFDAVPGCERRIIDFSGDGINNAGPLPQDARIRALEDGITINGLAVDRIGLSVTQYFRGHVIAGRAAFVETARGYRDYPRALRRKLFRELLPPSS